MRVGVVTTSYPRHPGDAAGGFVAELCQWIAESGHALEVVAAGLGDEDDTWHPWPVSRVLAAPGLFYAGGAPDALQGRRRHMQAMIFQARMLADVRKRAKKWDGMVAHWLAPSAIACALVTRAKPIWAIAHGGDVHTLARLGLCGATARLLDRRGVHLRFVSRALQDAFATNAGGAGKELVARSSIASMGIDVERFRSLGAQRKRNERPVILFLGRLVHLKGVDVLLDALVGLDRKCQVIIAGSGPLQAQLQARADKLGLDIQWTGELRSEARDALLPKADFVVIPSRSDGARQEGMPRVALEALASGCQLVVSRSGGLSEIPAGLCHQVPPDNANALRDMLRRVLDGEKPSVSADRWLADRSWSKLAPALLPGMTAVHNSLRSAQ